MMKNYRKQRGDTGEQLVVDHLTKHGYSIIDRNYRTRSGEIDIIGKKDATIAFIEVKWRTKSDIDPTTAVNYSKQQKIISTAKHFIAHSQEKEVYYRFDVGIISKNGSSQKLLYIPNAFTWNE